MGYSDLWYKIITYSAKTSTVYCTANTEALLIFGKKGGLHVDTEKTKYYFNVPWEWWSNLQNKNGSYILWTSGKAQIFENAITKSMYVYESN